MCTTVYYPRIKSLNFYDDFGVATGGMRGGIAKEKFIRLLKAGKFPRISLRKKVQVMLRGGGR
jgi:hypothetical protein